MTINTTATIEQLSNAWIVYGVHIGPRNDMSSPIYYGACPLHRAFELDGLGRNPLFATIVTRDTLLTIVELARTATKQEALTDLRSRLALHTPPCNAIVPTNNKGKRVRAPDGTIYDTAAQAAKAFDISPSAMSNHLTGRAGYATVKGMRFERLED